MSKRLIMTGYTTDDLMRENQKMEQGIPSGFACYLCKRRDGQEAAVLISDKENPGSMKVAHKPVRLTPYNVTLPLTEGMPIEGTQLTYMLCMECRALVESLNPKKE